MSQDGNLTHLAATVAGTVDDAISCLETAVRRADDAVQLFAGLGGSADQGQAVSDLIGEVRAAAQDLPDLLDDITAAVGRVVAESTPEEAIDHLGTAIDRAGAAAEASAAAADACEDATSETHERLRGSRAADDIADHLDEAHDHLDRARAGLDDLAEEARSQQESYRAGLASGPAPASTGSSWDARIADALPVRRRPEDPTAGVLTTSDGQKIDDVHSGKTGPARGGPGLKPPFRHMMAALDHAEGHAAAMIRARRLREATLYVNNQPCQGPWGCDKVLPHILPDGTSLTVYGPDGYHKTYRGTGKGLA